MDLVSVFIECFVNAGFAIDFDELAVRAVVSFTVYVAIFIICPGYGGIPGCPGYRLAIFVAECFPYHLSFSVEFLQYASISIFVQDRAARCIVVNCRSYVSIFIECLINCGHAINLGRLAVCAVVCRMDLVSVFIELSVDSGHAIDFGRLAVRAVI